MTAVQEVELALSEIEQHIDIPHPPTAADERIRIIWRCLDASGLSIPLGHLLSAGQGNAEVRLPAPDSPAGTLPPVTLSWSDNARLTVALHKTAKPQLTPAMQQAGIDDRELKKAVSAGSLEIGANHAAPLNITDPSVLIALLTDIIAAGWRGDVADIGFAAPVERLRHLDILIEPPDGDARSDALWIILPPRKLTKGETSRIREHITGSGAATVFPLLDLSGYDMRPAVGVDRKALETLLHAHETAFPKGKTPDIFPVLPAGTPESVRTDTLAEYNRDALNLSWGTTVLSAGETAALRRTMDVRYRSVLDSALEQPTTICGLLRQKTVLTKLKGLPELQVNPPRHAPFKAMQTQGLKVYVAAAAELAAQTAAEHQEKRSRRAQMLLNFLTPLHTTVSFEKDAAGIIEALIGDARGDRLPDDEKGLERMTSLVDGVFESVTAQIGKQTAEWQKELRKIPPESLTVPADVLSEETERAESLEYIWGTVIRLDLEKMKLKYPEEELQEVLTAARDDFLDYLNLTPADEKEFSKCLTAKWPVVAKKYTKKMHRLMEDTCQLWEVVVNQELDKIEEYRSENAPRSPKFPVDIVLQASSKPAIRDILDVKLKKPALTAKLFNSREKGLWRSESIMTIQKAAEYLFKDYETAVMSWFDNINQKIDAVKQKVYAGSARILQAEKDAAEHRNRERMDSIEKLKNLRGQYEAQIAEMAGKKKEIEQSRSAWAEIQESLHNTESAT